MNVITPPTKAERGLLSETNENPVAIFLNYGTAHRLMTATRERRSIWPTVFGREAVSWRSMYERIHDHVIRAALVREPLY